jgi:hypothetical protein
VEISSLGKTIRSTCAEHDSATSSAREENGHEKPQNGDRRGRFWSTVKAAPLWFSFWLFGAGAAEKENQSGAAFTSIQMALF